MSVVPVTSFGLILPTTVAAQLNRSLAARSSPVAAGAPLAAPTASLAPRGIQTPAADASLNPLAAPALAPAINPLAAPAPAQALSLSPLAATAPLAQAQPPQADQMASMMATIMQSLIQMICTMLGHNPGAAGTAGTAGTTGTGVAAQAVPLTSAQQLQQTVQQVNAQNPGASPQALAQLLNGRFSNTQFTPQPDGSLLYPLNGQNFRIAANGLTPPTQA